MRGSVTYEALVSDGNYSHVKVAVTLEIEEGETAKQTLARARTEVRTRVKADLRAMGDLRGWGNP